MLWARLSDSQAARIYVYGTTEFYGTNLFKALLEPGATVVDVGANLGEYTLVAAKYAGPTGAVFSFEPLPDNFQLLEKSIHENDLKNITLSRLALSNRDGDGILNVPANAHSGTASLVASRPTDRKFPVRCARLDTVLERDPARRVDIMKVDVEGFESEVFEGAAHTLAVDKPMVLFEVNGLGDSAEGVSARSIGVLRSHGYELYGVEALGGRRWRLVSVDAGEDPSRFRDRWQSEEYPPTLLAANPESPRTQRCLMRLTGAPDS